jgi:plastocyanin
MTQRILWVVRWLACAVGMLSLLAACDAATTNTLLTPATPTAVTPKPTKSAILPQLVIDNFTFKPQTYTVTVGTAITWQNQDDTPHTVTSSEKLFSSGALDTDDEFTHQFLAAGTYTYYCMIHPKMTGTIIVQSEASQ